MYHLYHWEIGIYVNQYVKVNKMLTCIKDLEKAKRLILRYFYSH